MSRRLLLVPLLLLVGALVFSACGTSPEDKAYDDGKAMGEAVKKLYNADDVSQAESALKDVQSAAGEIRDETRDHIEKQAQVQADTLRDGVANFQKGVAQSGASTALTSLQGTIQDLRAQASSFEDQNDSIANAFWRGYNDGFDDD
jgi:hypothetical protein